eukprot:3668201-Rhodomonas_salina.1
MLALDDKGAVYSWGDGCSGQVLAALSFSAPPVFSRRLSLARARSLSIWIAPLSVCVAIFRARALWISCSPL